MKRLLVVFLLLCCAMCAEVFAQSGARSIYVSAKGDDKNDGFSEAKPMKSLTIALDKAREQSIKTITVIGTLDWTSDSRAMFNIIMGGAKVLFSIDKLLDITITGKPGASGEERAVLSATGLKDSGVLIITSGAKVRFEHIQISGGKKADPKSIAVGDGILIDGSVILGPGTVVQNNEGWGIILADGGTCTIDGGEVRNNHWGGICIMPDCAVTMRSGTIRDNEMHGVGMFGGNFTMSGRTITGNDNGVYVKSGARFDQTGGTISGNVNSETKKTNNIYRAEGALGSNL